MFLLSEKKKHRKWRIKLFSNFPSGELVSDIQNDIIKAMVCRLHEFETSAFLRTELFDFSFNV